MVEAVLAAVRTPALGERAGSGRANGSHDRFDADGSEHLVETSRRKERDREGT